MNKLLLSHEKRIVTVESDNPFLRLLRKSYELIYNKDF